MTKIRRHRKVSWACHAVAFFPWLLIIHHFLVFSTFFNANTVSNFFSNRLFPWDAKLAHEAGLLTNYVTNAYITIEALDRIGPYLDAFRADLKGFSNETYKRIANINGFEGVLKVLEHAKHFWGMHVEIITNLIPGINDRKSELKEMAKWISDCLGSETPWHVTRFVPHFRLAHLTPTPVAKLEEARKIGLEVGLKYVYLGNVPGHSAENTHCPACANLLIERSNYRIVQYHLNGTCCGYCGQPIAGYF